MGSSRPGAAGPGYHLRVKALLGYFVGWPGAWEHPCERFWLGLGLIAGLWLFSATAVSWALLTLLRAVILLPVGFTTF